MKKKPQTIAIGVLADATEPAQKALRFLKKHYAIEVLDTHGHKAKVDVIVVLGGDGFMLHCLHRYIKNGIPFYGMNCGTVGFLMNEYHGKDLLKRLEKASPTVIHPLKMRAKLEDCSTLEAIAINEVSLLRYSSQAAIIRVSVDGKVQIKEMICDGVMVATPAGSSAYNASVGGPIIPIRAEILALTPISPFRPKRWHGALLPQNATIRFDVLQSEKRPVDAIADFTKIRNVLSVDIKIDTKTDIHLLFDPGHSLEERIIREQFVL